MKTFSSRAVWSMFVFGLVLGFVLGVGVGAALAGDWKDELAKLEGLHNVSIFYMEHSEEWNMDVMFLDEKNFGITIMSKCSALRYCADEVILRHKEYYQEEKP